MAIEFEGGCPLIQVFDMAASLHFYRDVLGFVEVQKSGAGDDVGWVWLRRGGIELMLNTAYDVGERPPQPDPARAASHADVAFFFGCEDLDGAHAHLATHGVRADPPRVAPYGMRQLHVRDPDGYGLCFQRPV